MFFFLSRISQEAFWTPILLEIETWKNFECLTKTIDKPFWKNFNFSTLLTSCFYSLEKRFSFLEYSKAHFPGQFYLK